VVVVAGEEHDLGAGGRGADRLQRRARLGEHVAQRSLAQLEHVAEQYQAPGACDRVAQRPQTAGVTQDRPGAARAEMQIRDDEGAQGRRRGA
jgi:hypothetical protein